MYVMFSLSSYSQALIPFFFFFFTKIYALVLSFMCTFSYVCFCLIILRTSKTDRLKAAKQIRGEIIIMVDGRMTRDGCWMKLIR